MGRLCGDLGKTSSRGLTGAKSPRQKQVLWRWSTAERDGGRAAGSALTEDRGKAFIGSNKGTKRSQ